MRLLALAAMLAALCSCATATRDVFGPYDQDKDGKLSLEEVSKAGTKKDKTFYEKRFQYYDRDRDGYLDRNEFDLWREVDKEGF
uniref:EF-hand domain-containing protein n=1 Tax=Fundidesulfovibrio putealis TaxID=270496 RepID=A0A7C3WG68_9BACT